MGRGGPCAVLSRSQPPSPERQGEIGWRGRRWGAWRGKTRVHQKALDPGRRPTVFRCRSLAQGSAPPALLPRRTAGGCPHAAGLDGDPSQWSGPSLRARRSICHAVQPGPLRSRADRQLPTSQGQVAGRARVRRSGGTLQSFTRCSSLALSLRRSLAVFGTSGFVGGAVAGSAAPVRPRAAQLNRTARTTNRMASSLLNASCTACGVAALRFLL
jgi:hypothetical protein